MTAKLPRDADWVRQCFLIKNSSQNLDVVDQQNRFFSSASLKFTDTTPGGNFAINTPPQFTRFADIKQATRFSGGKGMGRYYSEAIDDNAQVIHLRFGVPQFNSLTTFFSGFYNTGAGQLARTGRSTGLFYSLGKAVGFVVSLVAWPILLTHVMGVAVKFMFQKPSSKFYYLKPTMPLYWNAVQTMVNDLAVNRGIIPRVFDKDSQRFSDSYEFGESDQQLLHQLLPDIFRAKGGIDVYAMANRAGRLARKHRRIMQETVGNAANLDLPRAILSVEQQYLVDDRPDFADYIDKWLNIASSKATEVAGSSSSPKSSSPAANTPQIEATTEGIKYGPDGVTRAEDPGAYEFFKAEEDDASQFVSFRVNYTGAVQESFSNTVADSDLAGKVNSMSSSSRSTQFDFAGGNLDDGVIGQLAGAAANAAKDFFSGIGNALHISGLAALGGAAFVDIPKHWQSSSAQLPRSSYTINLVSPYGNPISQLINLYVPLSMLLAGALPLATGKQSYTSPFLCELYDRGRCQTRLGIIDSLSISRGTANLGFIDGGHATSIDITFTVLDLSSVMYMPIVEAFALNPLDGIFDEDTVFSDYMAVLSGMSMEDQIYVWRKFKLNLTRKLASWDSFFSASHFASFAGGRLPGRLVSSIFRGTQR